MTTAAYHLRTPSPVIAEGGTRMVNGTPIKTFVRYVARIGGKYLKPAHNGNRGWREPLVVDAAKAEHWMSMSDAMHKAGVPVKMTKDHLPRNLADSVIGDNQKLFRVQVGESEWLASRHDVRGEKNIAMAEANKDVSPEIVPEVKDSAGNIFRDVIAAISYVPDPVVTGQPEELAASMSGAEGVEEYHLSLSGDDAMSAKLCSVLGNHLGLADGAVTDDNAHTHLQSILDQLAAHKADGEKALSMSAELAALKTKRTVDPHQIKYVGRELDALNPDAYTPATKTALRELFVAEAKPTELLLSMASTDKDPVDQVEALVRILNANAPVKTGEATRVQHELKLSRTVTDDDGAATDAKKSTDRLIAEFKKA